MPKRTTRFGAAVEVEAAYLTPETMVLANDSILLAEEPGIPENTFANDGARGRDPATGRLLPRGARDGRSIATSLEWLIHGLGSAYAAPDATQPYFDLFRACGLQPTVVVTGGSESITLAPRVDDAFEGATIYTYPRGEVYKLKGSRGTFAIGGENGGFARAVFDMQGVPVEVPSDLTLPAFTYPTIVPPKAVGLTVRLGDFLVAVVRDWEFTLNATLTPALNWNNSDSHSGFILSYGDPELAITIEAPTLVGTPFHSSSGFNAEELLARATAMDVGLTVGTVQYNRFTLNLPTAQLETAPGSEDGPLGLRDLVFKAPLADPTSTADFSIVFD